LTNRTSDTNLLWNTPLNHAKDGILFREDSFMEPVCIIVPLIGVAIVTFIFQRTQSTSRLDQWANEQGYKLLFVERRNMFRGGFSWTTSNCQEVFRITVRDQTGQERSGYVRVGGHMLGQLSDRIDVKWDS
jgi:hypothetical protein